MDKVTAVKSQLKLREWAERISDCQASTMTVAAWCEANGIYVCGGNRPSSSGNS